MKVVSLKKNICIRENTMTHYDFSLRVNEIGKNDD